MFSSAFYVIANFFRSGKELAVWDVFLILLTRKVVLTVNSQDFSKTCDIFVYIDAEINSA